MSQGQEITIMVDQNGNFTLEVNGVKGNNCLTLTKPLEEALGGVDKRDFKPEYRQSSHQTNHTHLRQ